VHQPRVRRAADRQLAGRIVNNRGYPECAACGQPWCWLDRQWDGCPACDAPIPVEVRVDNDFKPYPVCMCGSVHVPDEHVDHLVVTQPVVLSTD
jgi:hypothetical protein